MPNFDKWLKEQSFFELEEQCSPCIRKYKEIGAPELMISEEYGGMGANILDAIRIQKAIASRSPSLALALTMHNFSVASLMEVVKYQPKLENILKKIAAERLLLASGFAEGNNNNIFSPTMKAEVVSNGIIVKGSKRPCTLSKSMDYLTASVNLVDKNGKEVFAIAMIPSNAKGIEVKEFWKHWVLRATETEEVFLHDVFVDMEHVFIAGDHVNLHPAVLYGLLLFELLASATYLGTCSRLVEKVIMNNKISDINKVDLMVQVEMATSALEGKAYTLLTDGFSESLLQETLLVRYGVENILKEVATKSANLWGGLNFLSSNEAAYLLVVCQLLSFHPPTKHSALDMMMVLQN